jgi:glucose-1-phosphate adenylyltransferase
VLDRAIVDKEVTIGASALIGSGDDLRPNRDEPERLYAGLTLIGKRASIPPRAVIGRNCRIDPHVTTADFGRRRRLASGETLRHTTS